MRDACCIPQGGFTLVSKQVSNNKPRSRNPGLVCTCCLVTPALRTDITFSAGFEIVEVHCPRSRRIHPARRAEANFVQPVVLSVVVHVCYCPDQHIVYPQGEVAVVRTGRAGGLPLDLDRVPSVADRVLAAVGISPIVAQDARTQFIDAVLAQQFQAEDGGPVVLVVTIEDEMRGVVVHRQRVGMEIEARTVACLSCGREVHRVQHGGVVDQRLQAEVTRVSGGG